MWFKSYEHLDKLSTTGRTDAQQILVTVLHTSGWTILKCISAEFDLNIPSGSRVMSIFINCPRPAILMFSKASSIKKGCYACQWLDNVEMHKYAQYDQNKPCGLGVREHFLLIDHGWLDGRNYELHPGITIVDCEFHPTMPSTQTLNIVGCN